MAQVNRAQTTSGGPTSEPTIAYLHTDLQGSTTLVTNKAGRPIDNEETWLREIFYDPFGRRTQADGTPLGDQRRGGPHQGYTSHEHDDELGLINMRGRIYDPDQRRFLTPDTLIPDPFNGQDYNRYAYVNNNPATATDPTGHAGLTAEMQQNSSYEELQGTDRTITMDINELSDGRRWGLTQDEKWAQSDGLKYVGNGGPEQLNATPAATTRSDGDNSSGDNTRSAEFEEEEEVDLDGGGANDLDSNGTDDDYEEPDADSGNPAAVAAPAGILGWFNKLVSRGKVSRAIGKAIEMGLHVDEEGRITASMKVQRGEYVMQTEREALQRAADLENLPARTGVKRSGGTKLGARGGGAFLWLMIIDTAAQAIYETDWATERRARPNNVSVEQQRENEKCAAGLCS